MTISRRGFLGAAAALVLAPAAVLGLRRRPDGILIECDTTKFGALGQEVSLKLQQGDAQGRMLTIDIPRARIVEGGVLAPAATFELSNGVLPEPWANPDDEVSLVFS